MGIEVVDIFVKEEWMSWSGCRIGSFLGLLFWFCYFFEFWIVFLGFNFYVYKMKVYKYLFFRIVLSFKFNVWYVGGVK